MVLAFLYFIFWKRMNPENESELMMEVLAQSGRAAGAQTTGPEAGITHQSSAGDSASPTNVVASDPEVKVAENAGFTYDVTTF